jgi:hypothetical protein
MARWIPYEVLVHRESGTAYDGGHAAGVMRQGEKKAAAPPGCRRKRHSSATGRYGLAPPEWQSEQA